MRLLKINKTATYVMLIFEVDQSTDSSEFKVEFNDRGNTYSSNYTAVNNVLNIEIPCRKDRPSAINMRIYSGTRLLFQKRVMVHRLYVVKPSEETNNEDLKKDDQSAQETVVSPEPLAASNNTNDVIERDIHYQMNEISSAARKILLGE